MKAVRTLTLLVLIVGVAGILSGQVAGTTANNNASVTTPAAANLRILDPQNGQKLGVDFVNVRYQLTNPAAGVNNLVTFQVQLDSTDPIVTSSTEHTFTGLQPGQHEVRVGVVDANGTPITGTRAEVRFLVIPTQSGPMRGPGNMAQERPTFVKASFQRDEDKQAGTSDPRSAKDGDNSPERDSGNSLPSSGSSLPILSVIGFGVLVGGIASALKTR